MVAYSLVGFALTPIALGLLQGVVTTLGLV
jgi:hypothetical protein